MMHGWRMVQIADLGKVVTGRTPPGNEPNYYGDAIPFLTPSDMGELRHVARTGRMLSFTGVDAMRRCLVPQGVGVSCIGWQMGKAVLINHPTITNQQINSIIINEDVADRYYVYYSLSHRRMEIFNLGAGGSRTPILNKGDFEKLPFLLPPLPEQRAIARFLGTLDDKIELNRHQNETLELMARALFKSWFVDFDPVRARAEGRDTGLPGHIADLFPGAFDDSDLGVIPKGWTTRPIEELAEVQGGSTPSTKESLYWDDGIYPWVTPKDLSGLQSPVLLESERKITDEGLLTISSGLLPKGTVLFSSRAPIGYMAIAEMPVAINQGFIAMKPRAGVSNLFLLFWAQVSHDEIVSRANGSTFLEISKSNFRPIRVVSPPSAVMAEFDRQTRPIYELIAANERECHGLSVLRDTMLPKLLSGELLIDGVMRSTVERP